MVELHRSVIRSGLIVLAFFGLGWLVYSNTLDVPFHFDDVANISGNTHIRMTDLSIANLAEAGTESLSSQRPIANISFALNYYFHRYEVFGYHVVNILIHVLTGIFFYLFSKITLYLSAKRSVNPPIPESLNPSILSFFAVLLWLVHPIQTQSVTYIVQRMNSMAAMFYLLSLVVYVKGRLAGGRRSWPWFAGCVLSGMLALGSKEIAVTLPFFIWLYEWYFFQDLSKAWLKRSILYLVGAAVLFVSLAVVYLGTNPVQAVLSGYDHRDFTLTQRVLTEFRVVMHYVGLLVFPHPSRLNLDYDFSISHSLTEPITTLFSISTVAAFIVVAILLAKKDRLVSFCIFWFLGNLALESSVIGLEIVFEHRNYLPSMFVIVLLVVLGYRMISAHRVMTGILCVVVVGFSFWTFERNSVWGDSVTLWEDCVGKSPGKPRTYNNLGLALYEQGKLDEAVSAYSKALRLYPDYRLAHNNLGAALAAKGDLDRAVEHFGKALQNTARDAEVHNNWGAALHMRGRCEEAVDHYAAALEMDPLFVQARNNLGLVFAEQGRFDKACSQFSKAVEIMPSYAEAIVNLGVALHRLGQVEQAIEHYLKALHIQPDHQGARSNLAMARKEVKKRNGSIERGR